MSGHPSRYNGSYNGIITINQGETSFTALGECHREIFARHVIRRISTEKMGYKSGFVDPIPYLLTTSPNELKTISMVQPILIIPK